MPSAYGLKNINTFDFVRFFFKNWIYSLLRNGFCQYHNMIVFKHLLSANEEHLLFCHLATTLCNNSALSAPPLHYYAKYVQDKKGLEKNCSCTEIFWHKNLFSSKMKSTLSFISNCSLCSVSTERHELPVVMSYIDIYKTTLDFDWFWQRPRKDSVGTEKGNLKLWVLIVFKVKGTALCLLILITAESSKTMEETSFHIPILRC